MEDNEIRTDIVSLGSKVTLCEQKSGKVFSVVIVSTVESKLRDGKISDESPVGKAVMGKKAKAVVTVEAPAGTIKYKIMKVER